MMHLRDTSIWLTMGKNFSTEIEYHLSCKPGPCQAEAGSSQGESGNKRVEEREIDCAVETRYLTVSRDGGATTIVGEDSPPAGARAPRGAVGGGAWVGSDWRMGVVGDLLGPSWVGSSQPSGPCTSSPGGLQLPVRGALRWRRFSAVGGKRGAACLALNLLRDSPLDRLHSLSVALR